MTRTAPAHDSGRRLPMTRTATGTRISRLGLQPLKLRLPARVPAAPRRAPRYRQAAQSGLPSRAVRVGPSESGCKLPARLRSVRVTVTVTLAGVRRPSRPQVPPSEARGPAPAGPLPALRVTIQDSAWRRADGAPTRAIGPRLGRRLARSVRPCGGWSPSRPGCRRLRALSRAAEA